MNIICVVEVCIAFILRGSPLNAQGMSQRSHHYKVCIFIMNIYLIGFYDPKSMMFSYSRLALIPTWMEIIKASIYPGYFYENVCFCKQMIFVLN